MLRVVDLFQSLQGEGMRMGCPTLFVRFYGCNLSCAFCDEPLHKIEAVVRERSPTALAEDILRLAEKGLANLGDFRVCFTGGEPLLQPADELCQLIEVLIARLPNLKFQFETNGTQPRPVSLPSESHYLWTVAPKSHQIHESWTTLPPDEVKLVLRDHTPEKVLSCLRDHFGLAWCEVLQQTKVWLQPVNERSKVDFDQLHLCLRCQNTLAENHSVYVGVSPQLHKLIDIL